MFLLNISRYKSIFLLPLLLVFALSFTLAGCSSKPAEEEIKITKRMKIKYPEKKVKKKAKKKVVKKKVVKKKPSVKWVSPKKATIKKKATAKKTVAPKKVVVAKKKTVTTQPKKAAAKPNYVVSVASFRERDKATVLRDKLSKAGYKAYVTTTVKDGTRWYRVRCGFFDGYSEAVSLKDKLVKNYYVRGAWVDKPTRAEVQEFAK